jgi:hypothetical protein
MTVDSGAVLVGFLAFLGVVLAPVVTGFLNQEQERRKERHTYILSQVTALIELRAELQYYQLPEWNLKFGEGSFSDIAITEEFRRLQIAFGKAYAIMVSVDIKAIRDKSPDVMSDQKTPSEKLNAIDFALMRLGEEYGFFNKR